MDFEFDVFVSYAHVDNTSADERHKGWVAKLHDTLDRRLTQLLGKPTRIWRDPKLKGNDVFEEVLVQRVTRAAVLLSVVSPRYVRSEWTIRELNDGLAEGTNIVNLKFGARTTFDEVSSLYVGYGHALTDDVWYNNILRVEYKYSF